MFDQPWVAGHGELVGTARAAVARLDVAEVGDAFLAGLTSRRFDLRSALGSYAVARHLPAHAFRPGVDADRCEVCGLIDGVRPVDRNVMNFERFKWGGVRRDDLEYVAFDLVQFARAPRLEPQDERGVILEILGVCGILRTGSHPGYADAFVPHAARTHYTELSYPVCWWRASDGVSAAGLRTPFSSGPFEG